MTRSSSSSALAPLRCSTRFCFKSLDQFILISYHKELLPLNERLYEVIVRARSPSKLRNTQDGRIDRPTEIGSSQQRGDIREPNVADDQKVDVALGGVFSSGDRTMHKGDSDTLCKRRKGCTESVDNTGRFHDESTQLGEDGRLLLCGKVQTIAFAPCFEDFRLGERAELSLEAGWSNLEFPCELREIKLLVRRSKKPREEFSPGLWEENIDGMDLTLHAYDNTLIA